jgi:hypothetical protein
MISGVRDRYVDITHEILYTPESLKEVLLLSGFQKEKIAIRELVAYAPDDVRFVKKMTKKIILPAVTLLCDMIINLLLISQGSSPRKNRPVLLSIAKK